MENAFLYMDGKKGDSGAVKFSASGYPSLTITDADILFERKTYSEALKYSEIPFKNSTTLNPRLNYRYAQILMELNRNHDVDDKLEPVIKSLMATPGMVAVFKTLYRKVKGGEAGFDVYA